MAPRKVTKADLQNLEAFKKSLSNFIAYDNSNLVASRLRGRSFTVPGVAEREIPRFKREEAIAKAREFVEKWPFVAGMIQTLADNIVGSGLRLCMLTKEKSWNEDVIAFWNDRKDALDIRGLRTWGQLNRLWFVRSKVDGDVGVYKYPNPQEQGMISLQTIEAERIRWRKFDYLDDGITVNQGCKFDKFGRPIGWFVGPRPENQMDWEKILKEGAWIDAADFVFYAHFPGDRADQIRGTSMLLQNFNLLQDIAEILDAVVQKVKNESFIALVFTMEQAYNGSLFGDSEKIKKDSDGTKRRHIKMVPGMNIFPTPGEKVDLLGLKSPNSEFMPFIRFLLRFGGTAFGLPLEIMLMDVSETNFSGGRIIMELAKKRFRIEQDALCRVCSNVARSVIDNAIALKKLKPPKSLTNSYFLHRWGRPVAPYFDPYKEAMSNELNLKNKLVSPQVILADSSELSLEDVLDQWQEFQQMCKDRGIELPTYRESGRGESGEPSEPVAPPPKKTKKEAE